MVYAVKNLVVQDEAGNVIEGAEITVRRAVPGEPIQALIYADRFGSEFLPNPFISDTGQVNFFCPGGAYHIKATKGEFEYEWRYEPVGRGAESDLDVITPQGTWDNAIGYNMGDYVSHSGTAGTEGFISMVDNNLNHEPDADTPGDTIYWMHSPGVTASMAEEILQQAREWAIKQDGPASDPNDTDYSSKAWAIGGDEVTEAAGRGPAKDWAIKTDDNVDTAEASAKAYAIGGATVTDTANRGAAKEWSIKITGTVDTNEYSAKAWAIGGTGVSETANRGSAKAWAVKTDDNVDTAEASAKAYALGGTAVSGVADRGASKEWAVKTNGTADAAEYSAKAYALGGTGITDVAGKGSAKEWAINPEDDPVAGGDGFSSLHWAAKSEASAIAAATSESNASDSAIAAATSESNASDSAIAAATSESNASDSAIAAATSESNAAASEADAEAALEEFEEIFLGSYSSAPTQTPGGNPLAEGMLYWNSTAHSLNVYDSSISAWKAYSAAAGITAVVEDSAPFLGGWLDANGYGAYTSEDSANRKVWAFSGLRDTPAAADSIFVSFSLLNDNEEEIEYVREGYESTDLTDSSEDGTKYLSLMVAGALTRVYDWTGTAFHSVVTGTRTLGTSAIAWLSAYVTTIYLGHATDTALTRSAAGKLDVAGHTVLTDDEENQGPITGGAEITPKNLGTPSNGSTLTLDMADRAIQHLTNDVVGFTLNPGSVKGMCILDIVNGSSAGTINVGGWTKVTGYPFTNVNGAHFRCFCSVGNWGSLLVVEAMD